MYYNKIVIGDSMRTMSVLVNGEYEEIVIELDPEEKDDMVLVEKPKDELENTLEIKGENND